MSDRVSCFGERLSSLVVAYALRKQGISARHLDARDVIVTDHNHNHAKPLLIETYTKVRQAISSFPSGCVPVMGGFIGSTQTGVPTTLGRGGSDYTAALVGAAIYAEETQIWTDVDGMLTCDPRVLANGHCLKEISYAEAKQMACFGAKVLHPDTVSPAMRQNVPVSIRNSRNPNTPGTRIVDRPNARLGIVKSIASKRNLCVFRVSPKSQPLSDAFVSSVVNVFTSWGVSVDLVSTSSESVTIVHEETSQPEKISAELNRIGRTTMEPHQALVCLVGEGILEAPRLLLRTWRILNQRNVKASLLETSHLNIAYLVPDDQLLTAMETLHGECFRTLDPNVFSIAPPESEAKLRVQVAAYKSA